MFVWRYATRVGDRGVLGCSLSFCGRGTLLFVVAFLVMFFGVVCGVVACFFGGCGFLFLGWCGLYVMFLVVFLGVVIEGADGCSDRV